jgi:hypothetical protein
MKERPERLGLAGLQSEWSCHAERNGCPMTDRQARAARNPQESLDAFLAEKARFDAMVAELQRMSADHFGADPDAVLWGEQATLQHWNSLLARVTDAYFKRGEWAE